MKIQSTHNQSFGRIIAPEKYVQQQLSQIKDENAKGIVKRLIHIVKHSKDIDILAGKRGQTVLRYNSPYSNVVGQKSRSFHNKNNRSTFIEAVLIGAIHDSKSSFLKLKKAFNKKNPPQLFDDKVKKFADRYKAIEEAKVFGIDKLVKLIYP